MAALSPFRHWVMGEEAMTRAATEVETDRIRGLLDEAIAAGAFGFSLTVMPQHLGYKGQPLACRLASHDELRAYSSVLHDHDRGAIEIALTKQPCAVSDKEYALLDLLSVGERPPGNLAQSARSRRRTQRVVGNAHPRRPATRTRMCAAGRRAPIGDRVPSAQSVSIRQHELDEAGLWRPADRSTKAFLRRRRTFAAVSARN